MKASATTVLWEVSQEEYLCQSGRYLEAPLDAEIVVIDDRQRISAEEKARRRAEFAAKEAAAAARKAETEAAEAARVKAQRESAWDHAESPIYLGEDGRLYKEIVRTRLAEGRFSSLGGWNPGGDEIGRSVTLETRDGEEFAGAWMIARGGSMELFVAPGHMPRAAGCNGIPETSATSDWIPPGAAEPKRNQFDFRFSHHKGEWEAKMIWEEIEASIASEKAAARAEKKRAAEKAVWDAASASPFAALAALKRGA
jgi:hypothetical protein